MAVKTAVESEGLDTETTAELTTGAEQPDARAGLGSGAGGSLQKEILQNALSGLPSLPAGLLSDANHVRADCRDLKSYMQAGVFTEAQVDAMLKKLGVIAHKGSHREALAAIRLLVSYAGKEREADLAREIADTPRKTVNLDLARLIEHMRKDGRLSKPEMDK